MISLYFHIPFCQHKCNYCSFYIIPRNTNYNQLIAKYTENLIKEIKAKQSFFKLNREKVYTIYFGGGTPSELGLENIKKVLLSTKKTFDLSEVKEFSFELNPFLANKKPISNFIENLKRFIKSTLPTSKIRFSIGIQSLNNKILKLANRNYSYEEVTKILEKLQEIKTSEVIFNLDFISFGVENKQDFENFKNFSQKFYNLIDSYSIYTLELFPGSIWKTQFKTNQEKILTNFKNYLNIIKKLNYHRYEISNFSKKGFESLHNQVYWELKPYLGIGTAASGFIKNIRYTNSYGINNYISGIFKYKEFSILNENEINQEYIFLGLRTTKGIKLTKNIEKLLHLNKVKELEKEKFIKVEKKHLKLTEKGFDVYNYILTEIMEI